MRICQAATWNTACRPDWYIPALKQGHELHSIAFYIMNEASCCCLFSKTAQQKLMDAVALGLTRRTCHSDGPQGIQGRLEQSQCHLAELLQGQRDLHSGGYHSALALSSVLVRTAPDIHTHDVGHVLSHKDPQNGTLTCSCAQYCERLKSDIHRAAWNR